MTSTSQVLAERLASGPLPIAEALRIGTSIAELLRNSHDRGAAHGALTPWAVALNGLAVELVPSSDPGVTAYTAPEILSGNPADARSDIFSFGAIFYELLTGRRAFEGSTPEELTASIHWSDPRPSGSPRVDRLMNLCLAKSPDGRYQQAQKLLLDLRLLSSGPRRGAATPTPTASVSAFQAPTAPPPTTSISAPAVNTHMRELEDRISSRMADQERAIANVAQVTNEVLRALREQQHQAPPPPAAAAVAPPPVSRSYVRPYAAEAFDTHSVGGVDRALDVLADRIARIDMLVGSAVERLQKLEENLDAFDTDAAALRDSVTRDVRTFERALKAQSTAIESARTAMGQTDDLVERVVEALDSLQSMFVNSEDRVLAS